MIENEVDRIRKAASDIPRARAIGDIPRANRMKKDVLDRAKRLRATLQRMVTVLDAIVEELDQDVKV